MSRVLSAERAKAALDKAKEELEQLRGQVQKISQDIFSAGGGA